MVTHPSPEIPQELVDKIVARRGTLHAYPTLDPARTALVVIDLDIGSCQREPTLTAAAIAHINPMANALRQTGGTVAFVTSSIGDPAGLGQRLGANVAAGYIAETQLGGIGTRLAPSLESVDGDVRSTKLGASAFFPGRCDLHHRLQAADIDSVLIAGTVTNVCCESSARDAMELGYNVTMVSDANVGHSFGLHEASLSTFYRFFGDVRPSAEVIALLGGSAPPAPPELAAWTVLDNIASADGTARVHLFVDPAGGYGFEHLECDSDGSGQWTPAGGYSSTRYATVSDAIDVARKSLHWLGQGDIS